MNWITGETCECGEPMFYCGYFEEDEDGICRPVYECKDCGRGPKK